MRKKRFFKVRNSKKMGITKKIRIRRKYFKNKIVKNQIIVKKEVKKQKKMKKGVDILEKL